MAVVTGSQTTLSTGEFGDWFSPTNASWVADIDGAGQVLIQTTRASGDDEAKTLYLAGANGQGTGLITGPSSVYVQGVVGRRYRFWCLRGPVAVAGDE